MSTDKILLAAKETYPTDDPRKNMNHDNAGQYSRQEAFIAGVKSDAAREFWEEQGWVSVETPPKVGDEYDVFYELSDGGEPLVTTMEFDSINNKWIDTRGASIECKTVMYWAFKRTPPGSTPTPSKEAVYRKALEKIIQTGRDWDWGEEFWAVKISNEALKH